EVAQCVEHHDDASDAARVTQLGDQTGLLVLCKRTGDLAHHLRVGSSLAVRSSPEAVSSRTPRLIRRVMPNSWAISSRANRLAASHKPLRIPTPQVRARL